MALSGGLENTFYEADSALIHNVRVGQSTLQLGVAGTAQPRPAGPPTTEEWARASKNAGEWGLEMREIGYCFSAGAVPTGFIAGRTYKANILTTAIFNGLTLGATVTVDSQNAEVVSKRRERRTPES